MHSARQRFLTITALYKFTYLFTYSMSADLYFTRHSFFFLSFLLSFFRPLISEVAEPNSTKIGHMVGSKCNLKTHVRNLGYFLPLQIGGPKTTFLGRLRNLTAILTAYIFGTKHDIENRSGALTTTRASYVFAVSMGKDWHD